MDPKRRKLEQDGNGVRLTSLPGQIQVKILSHAASNSVDDLFNLQRTCKSLHKAGSQQPTVLRKAAVLDKFHAVCTRRNSSQEQMDRAFRFLEDCLDSKNPESLFMAAVHEALCEEDPNIWRNLLKAASEGYMVADYFVFVLLLTSRLLWEAGNKEQVEQLRIMGVENMRGYSRAVEKAICCMSDHQLSEEQVKRATGRLFSMRRELDRVVGLESAAQRVVVDQLWVDLGRWFELFAARVLAADVPQLEAWAEM